MIYNRTSNTNSLDLNEFHFRAGIAKPILHKFEIKCYKKVDEENYVAIVTNSFINKVETIFHGETEFGVMTQAHDFCENIWNNAIENNKKNKERIKEANSSANIFIDTNDSAPTPATVGQHSGKKWMGNKITKERLRVPPHEVDSYLAQGWIFVGPRTKL